MKYYQSLKCPNISLEHDKFADIYQIDNLLQILQQFAVPYNVSSLIIEPNGALIYGSEDRSIEAFLKAVTKHFDCNVTSLLSNSYFIEKDSDSGCLMALLPLVVNNHHLANWFIRENSDERANLEKNTTFQTSQDSGFNRMIELFSLYLQNVAQNGYEKLLLKQKNDRLFKLWGSRLKDSYNYRFLNSVDEGVLVVQDCKLKYFNSIVCKLLGYGEEELRGMSIIDLVEPSDMGYLFHPIPRVLERSQAVIASTIHLIRKDRDLVLVEISSFQSVWGTSTCMYYFLTNVSVQKRCLENQKSANLSCLTIFKNTYDGIILIDVREHVLFISPSACKILGISELDVTDLRSIFRIHPEDKELTYSNLAFAIENSSQSPKFKLRITSGLGRMVWIECTFANLLSNPSINAIVISFRDISELIEVKNMAQNAFEFQNALLNAIPIPVFYKDLNCKYLGANKCFEEQIGLTNEQIIGRTAFEIFPNEIAELTNKTDLELLRTEGKMSYESTSSFADGSVREVSFNKAIFKSSDGQPSGIIGVIQDISEKNKLINSIKRTTRLYSFLSQINQSILRAKTVNELYSSVCDVAVKYGGFRFAWIGLSDDNDVIIPVVFAGFEDGYLESVHIDMHDSQRGNGIAGSAFKTGQIITCTDIAIDPRMEPWRENALKRDYHSAAGVPLICKGKIIGTLSLYSSEKCFFSEEEVTLLKEFSEDISFALDVMAVEAARIDVEEELRINNTRLEFAMQITNIAWWLMDVGSREVTFDHKMAEMLGYSVSKFKNYEDFIDLIHYEDVGYVRENMRDHILGNTERYEVEYRILSSSGEYKWYHDIGSIILRNNEGEPLRISGIVEDISERKKNEVALFQKEELLRESQIIAGLGGFEMDFVAKTWKGTEVLDHLMGFKRSVIHTIDDWMVLIHDEDRQRMYDYFLKEIFGARKKFDAIYRIVRDNDKQIRWVRGLGVVRFDDDGQMVRMRGTIQDITSQKLIEDELLEREQRYSAIFNENSAVMLIVDPRTSNLIDANEAACNFYGYSKSDLLTKCITDINIMPEKSLLFNLNNSLNRNNNHFFFQHRLASGEIRNVEVYSGPIKIRNTYFIYSIVHDITDRIVAETKMLKTSSLLNSIIESSPDIVIGALDTSYRYIAFNKKYKELIKQRWAVDIELGMSARDFMGNNSHAQNAIAEFDRALAGESYSLVEETGIGTNSPISWLKYWSPIKSETGMVTGITCFVLNITEQKRAEVLKVQNKELSTANADKDRFISILAHDLRTPFNSILGYLQLLSTNLRNYKFEEIEFQLNTITLSAKQAYTLLEDVLLWARTQAGKLSFDPAKCNLSYVVKEVIEEFRGNAEKKRISIECGESISELLVLADVNMLKTILRNFISNAIKFTDTGGRIDINAKISVDQIVISVSDTGVGMSEVKVKGLFDFKQNHTTLGTENEKGSGLGLLLCKEFIEKHGGTLCVESVLGKGSSFYFTMPVYLNVETDYFEETVVMDEPLLNSSNLIALVVEKEGASLEDTQRLLAPYCKVIHCSHSGHEALEVCRSNPDIDLIITDIQLSDLSGYEVIKLIREINQKVIIIAQSAFAVSGVADKALLVGCNEYFPKPYKQTQFATIIKKYFN